MVVAESVLQFLPQSPPPAPPDRTPSPNNTYSRRHSYEFLGDFHETPPAQSNQSTRPQATRNGCKPITLILSGTFIIASCALCLVILVLRPNECPSDYTYFKQTGYCYKANVVQTKFDKAKGSCESEEAHLASIHSDTENEFLGVFYKTKLAEHMLNVDIHQERSNVWLGLVYLDNRWQWTDGSPLHYINWAEGEPNDLSNHEYWTVMVVHKQAGWSPNGNEWNNYHTAEKHAYFCKKPSTSIRSGWKFTTIEAPTVPPTTTTRTTTKWNPFRAGRTSAER